LALSAIFNMAIGAVLNPNFKFELALFAILQYGSWRASFNLNLNFN